MRAKTACCALLLLAQLVLVGCGTPVSGAAAPAGPAFGTLVSPPERSADEARGGVSAAMVELSWASAEPAERRFDDDYLRSKREDVDALRSTGRTITLGLGMHDSPRWLLDEPDGRFVDEKGNESREANLVFNQHTRIAAEGYLAAVAAALDLRSVDEVRLTSGGVAEVLYPGGGGYWAFDRNAQGGKDLPVSMPPNPLPGWRPGQAGPDEAQVRAWADWYVGALADVVVWQVSTLSALGFRGRYQVLTPGVGVRPREYAAAVEAGLPPGLLGGGSAWQLFYSRLPRRADLVVYVSSVADGSGGNDVCQPDDSAVPVDSPAVEGWSAARWQTRLAREYGHPVAGENPGWGQSPELDETYVDLSDRGMMATSVRQARGCGFQSFYWAHAEQLWDGTVPFDAYAELIAGGS